MTIELDDAIVRLAKAQERQNTLASDGRNDSRDVRDACQDRDIFLADVVRLGLMHLRAMRDMDPDGVIDFGDEESKPDETAA